MIDQAKEWKKAMESKYKSLEANHTRKFVPLWPDREPIQCKWVHKMKYHSDDTINRYNAHLVAKGFTQKHDIDYFETYSPVVKHISIRIMLANVGYCCYIQEDGEAI